MKLDTLINPGSIAVIGASQHQEKVGYQIVANIVNSGYEGKVFPVNPNAQEILGLKVYSSIGQIEAKIDLAIIVIPAALVKEAVLECVKKGVSSLVIISAGFAEIDGRGKEIQDEIRKICIEHNVALLGPNCLGLINTQKKLNASFAAGNPPEGNVSLLSQSGAVISSVIDWSKELGVGFSKIFSLGNKALVDESELLEFLYADSSTKVIACYFESLIGSEKLTNVLRKNASRKPTVVLFGGRSLKGAEASKTHTGSVISSYMAIEAYLKMQGVLVARSMGELLLLTRTFSCCQRIKNLGIAIITNAGGPAIMTIDALENSKIFLSPFSPFFQKTLSELLPGVMTNPVDLLGNAQPNDYETALRLLDKNGLVSVVVCILTPQLGTKVEQCADAIIKSKISKPVLAVFVGGESVNRAKSKLWENKIPCFDLPEDVSTALSGLASFSCGENNLDIHASRKLSLNKPIESILADYHLPLVSSIIVESKAELAKAVGRLGFPLVAKTANKKVLHKTEIGGVVLGIDDAIGLEKAYLKLGPTVLLQPMIKGEIELFVGLKRDKNVGVTVLFGTGGIFAEIYADFSSRIAPFNEKEAERMIMETKVGKILAGARGQRKYNLSVLLKTIVSAGRIMIDYPEISELDFNPILANKSGYHIVDVKGVRENGGCL